MRVIWASIRFMSCTRSSISRKEGMIVGGLEQHVEPVTSTCQLSVRFLTRHEKFEIH